MPTCGRVGQWVRHRDQRSIGWLVPRRPVQCVSGHLRPRDAIAFCASAPWKWNPSSIDQAKMWLAGRLCFTGGASSLVAAACHMHAGATQPRDAANFFRGAHFPTGKSRRTAIILQPLVASKTRFFFSCSFFFLNNNPVTLFCYLLTCVVRPLVEHASISTIIIPFPFISPTNTIQTIVVGFKLTFTPT